MYFRRYINPTRVLQPRMHIVSALRFLVNRAHLMVNDKVYLVVN